MKKTKLMMPILGIAAIGSTIAPLTALTSCNKAVGLKVELYNDTTLENKLYANSKTINLFFKQNNTDNVGKTRVNIVNLKINGAEAKTVAGLTKITVDASGGIRVTFKLDTIFKHYSNPNTIEFDLLFFNKANNQTCLVQGFKFDIDQTKEVPHPFESTGTVITGFTKEAEDYEMKDFAQAYPEVFVEQHIQASPLNKDLDKNDKLKSVGTMKPDISEDPFVPLDPKPLVVDDEEEDVSIIFYKMVIPKSFTAIANGAFIEKVTNTNKLATTIPEDVIMLDFAPNSKLESIGIEAFASSNLSIVNLPSSLKELGVGCFVGTQHLISLQFAPTSDNKLTIPGGFLYGSTIPYLKLPTYIEKIDTYTLENEDPIPAIANYGDTFMLDLTEWTTEDIQKLDYTPGAIACSPSSATNFAFSSSKAANDAIDAKFILPEPGNEDESIFNNKIIPFTYEKIDENADQVEISMVEATFEAYAICIIVPSTIATFGELKFPFWKFELPNYGIIDDKKYEIVSLSASFKSIFNAGLNKWISSLVLPQGLEEISDGLLAKTQYLWDIYIPKSVKTFGQAAFALSSICSIKYEGTMAEWKAIKVPKESDGEIPWNYGCQEITVNCSDGTITIESTIEDETLESL